MDIMIDLETMGLKGGNAVLAIGAVAFDRRTAWSEPKPTHTFYRNIDLTEQLFAGATIDSNTLEWWRGKASPEARKALGWSNAAIISIVDAMAELTVWIDGLKPSAMPGKDDQLRFWARGPQTDFVILQAICDIFNIVTPWEALHQQLRDVRTWFDALDFDEKTAMDGARPADAVAHDALDDALYQAHAVNLAYAHSKGLAPKSIVTPPWGTLAPQLPMAPPLPADVTIEIARQIRSGNGQGQPVKR